jgi:sterol desaturase/sphingolipid hydroxylase (fatty acid hydroxylase superfamily)
MYLKLDPRDSDMRKDNNLVWTLIALSGPALWYLSPEFWQRYHTAWLGPLGCMLILTHFFVKFRAKELRWTGEEKKRHAEAVKTDVEDEERTQFRAGPYVISMLCRVPVYLALEKLLLPGVWRAELGGLNPISAFFMIIVVGAFDSCAEWFFHKCFMHDNLFGPPLAKTSHDRVHHRIGSGPGYLMTRDVSLTMSGVFPRLMPEGFLLIFILVFGLLKLTGTCTDVPLLTMGIVVGQAYQILYEVLHARNHAVKRSQDYGAILNAYVDEQAEHHLGHHEHPQGNYNVVHPFADRLFLTLVFIREEAKDKSVEDLGPKDIFFTKRVSKEEENSGATQLSQGRFAEFLSRVTDVTTEFWDEHSEPFTERLISEEEKAKRIRAHSISRWKERKKDAG